MNELFYLFIHLIFFINQNKNNTIYLSHFSVKMLQKKKDFLNCLRHTVYVLFCFLNVFHVAGFHLFLFVMQASQNLTFSQLRNICKLYILFWMFQLNTACLSGIFYCCIQPKRLEQNIKFLVYRL